MTGFMALKRQRFWQPYSQKKYRTVYEGFLYAILDKSSPSFLEEKLSESECLTHQPTHVVLVLSLKSAVCCLLESTMYYCATVLCCCWPKQQQRPGCPVRVGKLGLGTVGLKFKEKAFVHLFVIWSSFLFLPSPAVIMNVNINSTHRLPTLKYISCYVSKTVVQEGTCHHDESVHGGDSFQGKQFA